MPILCAYVLIAVLGHRAASSDELSFLRYATNLTHGFYAELHSQNPSHYLWHGPALPALLAPLVAIHAPLGLVRALAGSLLLFGSLAVLHGMVRRQLSPRGALLVTYGAALYLPFFKLDGVYVEPLATLCLTAAAFFMLRSAHGGRRDHLGAAVALALLALSRVEFGYVLLACLALSVVWWLAGRGVMARRSIVAFLLAVLLCAPWLIYTYSLTHKPLYWGNAGGLSLYWMTAPGNLGDWHRESDAFRFPQLASSRPVFTAVARLKPLDRDARLEHIALQNIRHHPGHYLANLVNNIGRLVFNSPYSFTRQKASSLLYAVPNALLLGLAAAALFVAVRVRRRLWRGVVPIAIFLALGFLVHVPLAAYARFVVPLVPATVWLLVAVLAGYLRITQAEGSARWEATPRPDERL